MRGVNRVMLIGNLGKDPDLQFLEGNIAVAKFSLATTESYKDKNGKLMSQIFCCGLYLPNCGFLICLQYIQGFLCVNIFEQALPGHAKVQLYATPFAT